MGSALRYLSLADLMSCEARLKWRKIAESNAFDQDMERFPLDRYLRSPDYIT